MKKLFTLLLFAATLLAVNKSHAQCDPPVNLQSSFSNNVSSFSWDPVSGANYTFQLKFSNATNWLTLATGLTTSSYNYTGLFQSASFNWRVISFCSPTDSAFSGSQNYTVPCEGPNTPIASNITGTSATVSWIPAPVNSGLVPNFSVSYRVLGSTGAWTSAGTTTNSSVTFNGLLSNTSYEWCVNKLCSYFNSAPLFGQFTTQYIPCDIPVNLQSLIAAYNQIYLSWNNVNGWANYYVQYKKATATNWTTVYVPNNHVTLSNLVKETLYDWRVMANCTNANQSVYSDVKQFTTYSNPCMAYGNNVNEGIDFFSLGTITRVSGKEVGGYYKSNLRTNLVKGSTNNTVTISAAYPQGIGYGDYFAVYIDYNKNGTFTDVGEQVVAPSVQIISQSSNYTSTFSVPNNAPLGLTKMRVILRRPGTAIVPCATGFQGEVEDYDVNIVSSSLRMSNAPEMVSSEIVQEVENTVFPNPSNGIYNISPSKIAGAVSYEILTASGTVVQKNKIANTKIFKIDISNMPSGLYLLRIKNLMGNPIIYKLQKTN